MSNPRKIAAVFALFVGLALTSVVIAQPAAAPATIAAPSAASPPTANEEYILGPEDVVEIEVVGTNDKIRSRVYTDGTIQANLVGRIMASGRTPRELGTEVASALKAGGYYAAPIVNVEITGFASRYVTVLGAVGAPGLVPINRRYRLSEILARVGGVREGAAEYVIVRPDNGPEKRYVVDKLASGSDAEDPYVSPGDKIFSPTAEVFYIAGEVKSPGSYPVKAGMTIAQAIARAGGLSESGSGKRVKVNRAGKDLKLDSGAKVEPGDVLTIPERLF